MSLSAALFSVLGVVCVVRPVAVFGKDHETAAADASALVVFCALAAAAAQSVAHVAMQRLQGVSTLTVTSYVLLATSALSLLWLLLVHEVRSSVCVAVARCSRRN